MHKLLIVEDEQWVREGLAELLDWSLFGIELAGTAVNGREGLQMARLLQPDIILTDIRMPVLDGLAMSREIRSFLPNARIVVLTGHDDFRYAKEAIGFQAADYLLKPISEDELRPLIARIAAGLDEERLEREQTALLVQQRDAGQELVRQKRFMDFLCSELPDERLLEKLAEAGFPTDMPAYALAAIQLESLPADPDDLFGQIEFQLPEEALATWASPSDRLLLICLHGASMDSSRIETLMDDMKDGIREAFGLEAVLCRCDPVDCMEALHACYRRIKLTMGRMLVFDVGRMIRCDEEIHADGLDGTELQAFLLQTNFLVKQILSGLKNRDGKRVSSLLEELFDLLEHTSGMNRNLLLQILAGLLSETGYVLTMLNAKPGLVFGSESASGGALFSLNTFSEMKACVVSRFFAILDELDSPAGGANHLIVQKARELLTRRHAENINIKTIAAELHVSANYLGYLFKKATGKSLSDALLDVRMTHAATLLDNPRHKVARVAELVGIPNTSYFCLLFRKRFGVSPGEYREQAGFGA